MKVKQDKNQNFEVFPTKKGLNFKKKSSDLQGIDISKTRVWWGRGFLRKLTLVTQRESTRKYPSTHCTHKTKKTIVMCKI